MITCMNSRLPVGSMHAMINIDMKRETELLTVDGMVDDIEMVHHIGCAVQYIQSSQAECSVKSNEIFENNMKKQCIEHLCRFTSIT